MTNKWINFEETPFDTKDGAYGLSVPLTPVLVLFGHVQKNENFRGELRNDNASFSNRFPTSQKRWRGRK